jgi:hypothetical protein
MIPSTHQKTNTHCQIYRYLFIFGNSLREMALDLTGLIYDIEKNQGYKGKNFVLEHIYNMMEYYMD